ncbi:MAG: hypothetical protein ACI9BH_001320, partial [Paracoccaceae bacterium]
FALLLFSIGSIFAYFGASGKQGAVHPPHQLAASICVMSRSI